MSYQTKEIKKGIKLHVINTNKFKTNLLAMFITVPLSRETVTLNTLLPAVLKRGTTNFDTQEKINIELENMYGSVFDCGIDKIGDNHVIKFYLESLNDNFIQENAGAYIYAQLERSTNLLLDIIFNPLIINNQFKEEYVNAEKNNIRKLIEAKIDNKDMYALTRCVEEMYKDKPYGLYKYGYSEDLEDITAKSLYNYYINLRDNSKIDIFVSGDIDGERTSDMFKQNLNVSNLKDRDPEVIINNEETEIKGLASINKGGDMRSMTEGSYASKKEHPISSAGSPLVKGAKFVEEKMDIGQGKLVLGLDVSLYEKDSKFPISIYNVILRRKCYI